MTTIAIIGGGAAGMMTAATILQTRPQTGPDSCQIMIFDKNPGLGAKVIISGGGRCNVTTSITDHQTLLTKYTRGSQFLRHVLKAFSPQQVYDRFVAHGVSLKTQDDQRVFPVSDDGHDVVGAFQQLFARGRVDLHLGESVRDVTKHDDHFIITTSKKNYHADYLVLATGGNAYRHTGSAGDGYAFASSLGHTITQLGPSLSSFTTRESRPKTLAGLSFPEGGCTGLDDASKKIVGPGPVLCTHHGVTGPSAFIVSSHYAFRTIDEQHPQTLRLVPVWGRDFATRDILLTSKSAKHPGMMSVNFLALFFPDRFAAVLCDLAELDARGQVAHRSKKQRQGVVRLLSEGIPLTLIGRRAGDEFVTAGGVSCDEVSSKTCESRLVPGLFIVGELLDVDGVTGGFNLQSSWATGYVAGREIGGRG